MGEKLKDDYLKLLLLRERIINLYYEVYSDYQIAESVSLDEDRDITLDFVNCTICLAKENISKGEKNNNYVMVQPCLRNNHINLLSSYFEESNYLSYFTMLGGFYYIENQEKWIDEFNKIVQRQFNFFRKIKDDIEIRLTVPYHYFGFLPLASETKKLIYENNGSIIYSKADKENLKWKYGIDGIIGYGTRWKLKDINGKFVNCGNDILLFDEIGNAIGIDFGSGLETIVSVLNGEKNLLYSNIVCSDYIRDFCNYDSLNEKLVDSLLSFICCEHYKKRKNFRIKYLMFLYMRIISAILLINDISIDLLNELIIEICKNINIEYEMVAMNIISQVSEQQKFLDRLSKTSSGKNAVKYFESKRNRYERKLLNMEVYALKKLIDKEEKSDKTKKIRKR